MITEVDIHLPLKKADAAEARRKAVAQALQLSPKRVMGMRLLKESIDARRRPICKQLRLLVGVDEPLPPAEQPVRHYAPLADTAKRVVIVGSGPGGLFAALRCLELGLRPIVLERGKDVTARRFDLQPLHLGEFGGVNTESNYCFGEGGAGTFSDGKLFTRATKRGPVMEVYETFVAHGASPQILTDAHPHIGSDRLPDIIKAMRHSILNAGGEVHFETRMCGLLRSADGKRLLGVRSSDGREWPADAVILATGHSARDVYRLLHEEGLLLERKAFAVGVRIEHPQALIDAAQYHLRPGEQRPHGLPAARYALATKIEDRGVHSFCMCPGGHIVPSATAADEVVVNGMSLSQRNSPYANSGFVVTVEPQDTDSFAAEHGVLSGIAYQRALETATSLAGGGQQKAPAQRVQDFLKHRVSATLPTTTYEPGLTPWDLHALLPAQVAWRMQEGLQHFNRKLRGFAGEDALLIGCETRTSSPVRIPRDKETLQHPQLQGLYPCGEGAGFAGGIVSAALDGRRCAEAVAGMQSFA
ncbi:MAG: FAD-binding protein [Akkermansiaceae bacterium]|nr:FAD-binding protein [Akkermansiaceae bacterium]